MKRWLRRLDFGRVTMLAILIYAASGLWLRDPSIAAHPVLMVVALAYGLLGSIILLFTREPLTVARGLAWGLLSGASLLVALVSDEWPFWATLGAGAAWQVWREQVTRAAKR